MINLSFNYSTSYYFGDKRHAEVAIREMGISYEFAIPQSMGNCFYFFNCENIPDELPKYIDVKDFTIEDYNYYKKLVL